MTHAQYIRRLLGWWSAAIGAFTVGTFTLAGGIWTAKRPEHGNTFIGYAIDTAQTAIALGLIVLGCWLILCAAILACVSFEEAGQ